MGSCCWATEILAEEQVHGLLRESCPVIGEHHSSVDQLKRVEIPIGRGNCHTSTALQWSGMILQNRNGYCEKVAHGR